MITALEKQMIDTTQTLSMTPNAVRSRARRAASNALLDAAKPEVVKVKTVARPVDKVKAKTRKQPTVTPIKVSAAQKRTIGQMIASVAAGFLPIASFVIAHQEAKSEPLLWILVAAALMFSAPTLASWAEKWCGNKVKAWGFTVLLEGCAVFAHTEWLSYLAIGILVLINSTSAWNLYARKTISE